MSHLHVGEEVGARVHKILRAKFKKQTALINLGHLKTLLSCGRKAKTLKKNFLSDWQ